MWTNNKKNWTLRFQLVAVAKIFFDINSTVAAAAPFQVEKLWTFYNSKYHVFIVTDLCAYNHLAHCTQMAMHLHVCWTFAHCKCKRAEFIGALMNLHVWCSSLFKVIDIQCSGACKFWKRFLFAYSFNLIIRRASHFQTKTKFDWHKVMISALVSLSPFENLINFSFD